MPAWAGLHGLAVPVQQALGALRQPSGLWRDFLAATACWPLDLPLLLLDDLGLPEGMARDHTERQLFNAAALQAAAVVVSEAVLAGDGCADHAHTLLVHGLLARAQWALRATLPQADAAGGGAA